MTGREGFGAPPRPPASASTSAGGPRARGDTAKASSASTVAARPISPRCAAARVRMESSVRSSASRSGSDVAAGSRYPGLTDDDRRASPAVLCRDKSLISADAPAPRRSRVESLRPGYPPNAIRRRATVKSASLATCSAIGSLRKSMMRCAGLAAWFGIKRNIHTFAVQPHGAIVEIGGKPIRRKTSSTTT